MKAFVLDLEDQSFSLRSYAFSVGPLAAGISVCHLSLKGKEKIHVVLLSASLSLMLNGVFSGAARRVWNPSKCLMRTTNRRT